MKYIGNFDVTSGELMVSDPCYERGAWCHGVVQNVVNGKWSAHMETLNNKQTNGWGERVSELVAVLNEEGRYYLPHLQWEKVGFEVGVDSGQAGIFCNEAYQKPLTEPYLQVGNLEYDRRQYEHLHKSNVNIERGQLLRRESDALIKDPSYKRMSKEQIEQHLKEFDLRERKHIDELKAKPTMDWYEMCCDKTLSNENAGVIPGGVVSSSGYGDGGYDAFIAKNSNGQVIGVKIVFLLEEEDDYNFE